MPFPHYHSFGRDAIPRPPPGSVCDQLAPFSTVMMRLARQAYTILADMEGVRPYLKWGSLLGAVKMEYPQPWDHDIDMGVEILVDQNHESTSNMDPAVDAYPPCDVSKRGNQCYDVFRLFHDRFRRLYENAHGYRNIPFDLNEDQPYYVTYRPQTMVPHQMMESWFTVCKLTGEGVLAETWGACFSKLANRTNWAATDTQLDLSFDVVRALTPNKGKVRLTQINCISSIFTYSKVSSWVYIHFSNRLIPLFLLLPLSRSTSKQKVLLDRTNIGLYILPLSFFIGAPRGPRIPNVVRSV